MEKEIGKLKQSIYDYIQQYGSKKTRVLCEKFARDFQILNYDPIKFLKEQMNDKMLNKIKGKWVLKPPQNVNKDAVDRLKNDINHFMEKKDWCNLNSFNHKFDPSARKDISYPDIKRFCEDFMASELEIRKSVQKRSKKTIDFGAPKNFEDAKEFLDEMFSEPTCNIIKQFCYSDDTFCTFGYYQRKFKHKTMPRLHSPQSPDSWDSEFRSETLLDLPFLEKIHSNGSALIDEETIKFSPGGKFFYHANASFNNGWEDDSHGYFVILGTFNLSTGVPQGRVFRVEKFQTSNWDQQTIETSVWDFGPQKFMWNAEKLQEFEVLEIEFQQKN